MLSQITTEFARPPLCCFQNNFLNTVRAQLVRHLGIKLKIITIYLSWMLKEYYKALTSTQNLLQNMDWRLHFLYTVPHLINMVY